MLPALAVLPMLLWLQPAAAFYFSQLAAHPFHQGEPVGLWYNKIFSTNTQVPFAYVGLPFACGVDADDHEARLNFGELFRGDRIIKSAHEIAALDNRECVVLCTTGRLGAETRDELQRYIKQDYRVEWIVDDLPAGDPMETDDQTKAGGSGSARQYNLGFQLGVYDEKSGVAFVHNHHRLVLMYEKRVQDGAALITGFEVYPTSSLLMNNGTGACNSRSSADTASDDDDLQQLKQMLPVDSSLDSITYSYSVEWVPDSEVKWSHRWDRYIENSDSRVHWYSIANSLMLLVFLTVIVAIIMFRTLNHDISAYNNFDVVEDQEEVLGWKLVHGDVFRPPRRLMLLSVLVGSGVQIFATAAGAISLSIIGLLNPSYRGGLVQYTLLIFSFAGAFAGYHSARIYKAFNGVSWKVNGIGTATVLPLFLFIVLCIVNTYNWHLGSSSALPAGTFVSLIALWMFVLVPLALLGSYFGFKKQAIAHPVRVNQIPRQIPEQSSYLSPLRSAAIAGVMPFAVIFMELYFVIRSMWEDQYYYMFGFIAVVFVILMVTCIEITIVMVYFQLCSEDYRWHWKSFILSSSSTWYILGFALFYFWDSLSSEHHQFMSGILFFSKLATALAVYFCCTGMMGFVASYLFLRHIYAAVKID